MNMAGLNRMLRAEKGSKNMIHPKGFKPIYYYNLSNKAMHSYYLTMNEVSLMMWTYFGYTGLITPWHDDLDSEKIFNFQQRSIIQLIKVLKDNDISLETYCILVCIISSYDFYERPALLFGQRHHWSWIKKLRKYAGSSELVDIVAKFVKRFIELQVEHKGKAFVKAGSIVDMDTDGKRKAFVTYNKIVDRIRQLAAVGVDNIDWLESKFEKCVDFKPDQDVYIKTIVNHNGLDPDVQSVKAKVNDPWREIRKFFGLSNSCEFPDGCIPKGWVPSRDDFEDIQKIVRIKGDGFYYYADGTQRRGKRHYAQNTYLGIQCNPNNFKDYKDDWYKRTMLTTKPTWEEYRDFAIHPGMWDENGDSTNGKIKSVKWRKGK